MPWNYLGKPRKIPSAPPFFKPHIPINFQYILINQYARVCLGVTKSASYEKLDQLNEEDVACTILSIIQNPIMTGELIRLDLGAHVGKANPREKTTKNL